MQAQFRNLFKFILAFLVLFTAVISAQDLDTLEIYALKVEFKYEDTDNSLTTGRGLFDSDADTASANYSLDPMGNRASSLYWTKHFEFAHNYFAAASCNKVAITSKIYPQQKRSYVLDKGIIDYNRTARKKDEKVAEFDEARSKDYMTFVWDALQKAAEDGQDSPFADALPKNPRKKRVYMIIHAGASRLVDGGSMGTGGADTPGDFMDVFVNRGSDTWGYLAGDAQRGKSQNGFVLQGFPVDTIHEVMVVSETASQDGLNWGINGIMVNQIAQQLGMPQTYDVVKGISRLGYFDVMDFAGYSAANGFLPVLPSAWLRSYMGWATPVKAQPNSQGEFTVDLKRSGSCQNGEIVRVDISPSEYLLIENRQRGTDAAGKIKITLDDRSVEMPVDSLHLMFQDSICNDKGTGCKVNKNKAKGIITNINSFDAAIPASGVAVWHVNDWVVREALQYKAVNFWAGDTFRDHHFGLALVEADGIPSLGKEFKNALGEAAYDYGSGADLLPHIRKKDTVNTLKAQGYSNTGSTLGAYSGITIKVQPGSDAKMERTANSFMGDSVSNWRAATMKVSIKWGANALANSQWPRRFPQAIYPGLNATVALPTSFGQDYGVVSVSGQGVVQVFGSLGEVLLPAGEIAEKTYPSLADSVEEFTVWPLGAALGATYGLAVQDSSIYTLHAQNLYKTKLLAAGEWLSYERTGVDLNAGGIGPMLSDGQVWVADAKALRAWNATNLKKIHEVNWPPEFNPTDLASCGDLDGDGMAEVVVVSTDARMGIFYSQSHNLSVFPLLKTGDASVADDFYRVACTDFNRDGKPDGFVLGNYGTGMMVDLANITRRALHNYSRGQRQGTLVQPGEMSPIALADLNDDGYPEAVFMGYNLVYAVDSNGIALPGFPVNLTKGAPEELLFSTPLVLDVNGDDYLTKGAPEELLFSTPLALDVNGDDYAEILVPLSSGAVLAVDHKGKILTGTWPRTGGFTAYDTTYQPLDLWVAPGHSQGTILYSAQREYVNGQLLQPAQQGWWLAHQGGPQRQSWLDPQLLKAASPASSSTTIDEFFLFPNPVRQGKASVRYRIGAVAQSATLKLFDIAGNQVLKIILTGLGQGAHEQVIPELAQLGSDVYAAQLEVKFTNKIVKTKWDRIAVVR